MTNRQRVLEAIAEGVSKARRQGLRDAEDVAKIVLAEMEKAKAYPSPKRWDLWTKNKTGAWVQLSDEHHTPELTQGFERDYRTAGYTEFEYRPVY